MFSFVFRFSFEDIFSGIKSSSEFQPLLLVFAEYFRTLLSLLYDDLGAFSNEFRLVFISD
jgi:hypothetical protein